MGSGQSKPHEPFALAPSGLLTYKTPKAFETALMARLKPVAVQLGLQLTDLRRQFAYDRFLFRAFQGPDADGWVLKGGGAMLARDRRARHTTDLDLLNRTHDLGEAVEEIRAAAARDAGDFLTFGVQKVVPIAEGEAAPVSGRRVFLDVRCGAAAFAKFHVDVVVEDTMTGAVEQIPTAALVTMPGITRPTVRLYPITDHIADKVLAAVSTYGPRQLPSSRVRDLVDLAIHARTTAPLAGELAAAITAKRLARQVAAFTEFTTPPTWASTYPKQSPASLAPPTYGEALAEVSAFLDPVLDGTAQGCWDPDQKAWVPPPG